MQEHAGRVDHRPEQLCFQLRLMRAWASRDDILSGHGLSELHAVACRVDCRARRPAARNACGTSASSEARTRSTLGSCRRGSIPAAYTVRNPQPPASHVESQCGSGPSRRNSRRDRFAARPRSCWCGTRALSRTRTRGACARSLRDAPHAAGRVRAGRDGVPRWRSRRERRAGARPGGGFERRRGERRARIGRRRSASGGSPRSGSASRKPGILLARDAPNGRAATPAPEWRDALNAGHATLGQVLARDDLVDRCHRSARLRALAHAHRRAAPLRHVVLRRTRAGRPGRCARRRRAGCVRVGSPCRPRSRATSGARSS